MGQEALADRLGYKSYTTIQKWESGVSEPPIRVLHELSEIFNVHISKLTTEDIEADESFHLVSEENRKPAIPEWYDGLTEEQKEAIRLIARLPEDKLDILLRVAEQMSPPRSQETD